MKRIFLIDDDTMVNVLNKKVLSGLYPDAELVVFRNGLEALNQFMSSPPDLCLIDINMPQISGYEFLDKLKSKEMNLHGVLIVLSGFVSKEEEEKVLAAGAAALLEKPLTADKLKSVLI